MDTKKEISYPDSNRVGKFKILHEVLTSGDERAMLHALFGLCVILDTVDHESGRGKEYIAASELFQPLAEGEEIPDYRIEFATQGRAFTNPEHEVGALVAQGGFRFKAIRQIIVRVPPATLMHRVPPPVRNDLH